MPKMTHDHENVGGYARERNAVDPTRIASLSVIAAREAAGEVYGTAFEPAVAR